MKWKYKDKKDGDTWIKRKFLFLPMMSIQGDYVVWYWLEYVTIKYVYNELDLDSPAYTFKSIVYK